MSCEKRRDGIQEIRDNPAHDGPFPGAHGFGGLEEGISVNAEEPWPDRALMVASAALRGASRVVRAEGRIIGRERAQAEGREELSPRNSHDPLRLLRLENREGQGRREQLVGTHGIVRAAVLLTAPYVAQGAVREQEAFPEDRPHGGKVLRAAGIGILPLQGDVVGQGQSIVPQGFDFHRIAVARRDGPAVNLHVHPGELGVRRSHVQETAFVRGDEENASLSVGVDDAVEGRGRETEYFLPEDCLAVVLRYGREKGLHGPGVPQGGIDAVIPRWRAVSGEGVGDEAVADARRDALQHGYAFFEAPSEKSAAGQGNERVTGPRAEPVVAREKGVLTARILDEEDAALGLQKVSERGGIGPPPEMLLFFLLPDLAQGHRFFRAARRENFLR